MAEQHLVVATDDAERRDLRLATLVGDRAAVLRCDPRRGGPYAGTSSLLLRLVPDVWATRADLVGAYAQELLTVVPELEALIGAGPATLTSSTPAEQRTRFVGASWIRAISQGVVGFLLECAELRTSPWTLAFDEVDRADPTQQELVALLLRRGDPARLRVVVGTAAQPVLVPELVEAVRQNTDGVDLDHAPTTSTAARRPDRRPARERAAAYVAGRCLSPDADLVAAYDDLDDSTRARLHDAEADRLEPTATWADRLGPLPFHRERGSDPGGAGRRALRTALDRCVGVGFSAATLDFGLRGRAVCDPVADELDYCHFTAKAAVGLVALDRAPEAEPLYLELRRRYATPRVHMTTSYGLAMLHTRFLQPRDHELAIAHQHTAIALAAAELGAGPEGTFQWSFHRNGLALIEMHRGRLDAALTIVEDCITRVDAEIPGTEYLVHRTQLVHNRARLLVALGRLGEAYQEYSRLLQSDPGYLEYWADRAALALRLGDPVGALADYDRAVAVSPPMAELHYNRADVLAELGCRQQAIDELLLCVELEPGIHDAWVNLVALLSDTDESVLSEPDRVDA